MPQNRKTASDALSAMTRAARVLAPNVLGLMCARTCLIVATYGSYNSTDAGVLTDGGSLAAMAPLLVFMAYLGKSRRRLSKGAVFAITNAAIGMQAASTAALGLATLFTQLDMSACLALSAAVTLSSWLAIFYWLRRARNTSSSTAAALTFGALLLSEPLVYAASFLPHAAACGIVGLAAMLQFPLRRAARRYPLPAHAHADTAPLGYFGFARRAQDGAHVLGILAFGLFVLSFAVGALRGFPDGQAVAFAPATRAAYMLLAVALCAMLIWGSFRESRSVMTTTVWVALEALGIFAVAAYAAFPERPDIGAVFTTVFNAGMTGFMWYLAIAFSSVGKRDPYYYAAAGWATFVLPRAIARMGIMAVAPLAQDGTLQTAVVAGLILASAQVVFVQLVWSEYPDEKKRSPASRSVRALLGLDDEQDVPDDSESIRRALMQNNARQIKSQFMLSERETEVLAMYASGLTQRKIAEELCISPGTAHTHIKRIYAKTDLHSRQEILDYIERYTN